MSTSICIIVKLAFNYYTKHDYYFFVICKHPNISCPISCHVMFYFLQDKMSPLPVTKPIDPVDREVGFMPTKTPYDPRWMLAGRQNPSKYFIRGSQIMHIIIITMQLLVIISCCVLHF